MELGEADDSGRRRPVVIEGSEYDVEVDMVIHAISQEPDIDNIKKDASVQSNELANNEGRRPRLHNAERAFKD